MFLKAQSLFRGGPPKASHNQSQGELSAQQQAQFVEPAYDSKSDHSENNSKFNGKIEFDYTHQQVPD